MFLLSNSHDKLTGTIGIVIPKINVRLIKKSTLPKNQVSVNDTRCVKCFHIEGGGNHVQWIFFLHEGLFWTILIIEKIITDI